MVISASSKHVTDKGKLQMHAASLNEERYI
jgi:hypothetical protein